MERASFFVQVNEPGQPLPDILCQLEPMGRRIADEANDIVFRWECQKFRRLPKTGAILFSVKTELVQLTDMDSKELNDFAIEAKGWPDEVATYKRRHEWGECAFRFCDTAQKMQKELRRD